MGLLLCMAVRCAVYGNSPLHPGCPGSWVPTHILHGFQLERGIFICGCFRSPQFHLYRCSFASTPTHTHTHPYTRSQAARATTHMHTKHIIIQRYFEFLFETIVKHQSLVTSSTPLTPSSPSPPFLLLRLSSSCSRKAKARQRNCRKGIVNWYFLFVASISIRTGTRPTRTRMLIYIFTLKASFMITCLMLVT